MKNKNINDLRHKDMKKLLISLAIPGIIANFIQAMYTFVDRIFISNMIGEKALAGVTQGNFITLFGLAFTMLFGFGGSMLFSVYLGKQDYKTAQKIKEASFVGMFIFVPIFVFITMVFMDNYLEYIKIEPDIAVYLKDFYSIIIPGRLIIIMGFAMSNFTTSEGHAKKAMKYVMTGGIVNIVLDPILIHFMGIRGAAFATVIAQLVTAIFTMRYHYKYSAVKMELTKLSLEHIKLGGRVIKNGFPVSFRMIAIAITTWVMTKVINDISGQDQGIYSAILGAVQAIEQILIIPIMGFTTGMQPIVGYNYGAKQFDRVRSAIKYSVIFVIIFAGFLQLTIFLAPKFLMNLFIKDPMILKEGIFLIKVFFLVLVLRAVEIIFTRYFQSISKVKLSMVFLLIAQFGIAIPSMLIVSHMFGIYGVFYSIPVSNVMTFLVITGLYFFTIKKDLKVNA